MNNEHTIYSPIPHAAGQVTGWKDIPIREDKEPERLVPLGPLSPEAGNIITSSVYFGEHSNSPYAKKAHTLRGSLLTLFVRQSVARRLMAAERLLPAGHRLVVFDAYRPYQVQKSLYNFYRQKLQEKYPDMDTMTLDSETQKYVSVPSLDRARPSPHNTGGAVDVAIIKLDPLHETELHHAKMLNFGTAFDHGGEKSALTYYEAAIAAGKSLTDTGMLACNNRRLLYTVMTKAGFEAYFAEWWHFNAPESQMGAAAAGRTYATFGAIKPNESNRLHERLRREIRSAADLKTGQNWPVEIIAPPRDSLLAKPAGPGAYTNLHKS